MLSGVRVPQDDVLGDPGGALPAIEHVVDEAIAALCAEAVGTMQEMHETTLEYLKTRQQFGRPIGQFQVLQHRSVDMLVALEQARSMAMFAAVMAARRERHRAPPRDCGGEGTDRPLRPAYRSGGHSAARRHRHDDGVQGRPSTSSA